MLNTIIIERYPISGLEDHLGVFNGYWYDQNISSLIMIQQISLDAVYFPKRLFYFLSNACNRIFNSGVEEIVIDQNLRVVLKNKERCDVFVGELNILCLQKDNIKILNEFIEENIDQ